MRKTLSTENFKIHVFGTDDNSFNVTAVILQKEADAYLINAGFTKATANELVDFISTEKLNLKGAFVIHGDPDYYFGMEQILRSVPKLEILSTEETQQHIAESVIGKLAVWELVKVEPCCSEIDRKYDVAPLPSIYQRHCKTHWSSRQRALTLSPSQIRTCGFPASGSSQ